MNPEEKKNSHGGARLAKEQKPPKQKRPKPELTSKEKALRALLIVLTAISVLIVTLFVAYKLLVVKPQLPGGDVPEPQASAGMEMTGPKLSGDRKEEFYTFLVVGRDTGGGGNTDTIMVMSYDIPNQKLNVLNIPRDTMVNVPWDVKKVNSIYNWASRYDRDGIDYLKEEISYLIGFQPDFTVVVEWEAVGELVDAVGPVTFDVPYDMDYDDGTQDLYIHLKAGVQEIDGNKAMQLLRWRKNNKIENGKLIVYGGYPSGDLGRIQTQQDFLKAVIDKCLSSLSVDKIPALAQIFMNNVDTRGTLTVNNIAWFAKEAIVGGLSMEHVSFMTLPCQGAWVYSRTVGNKQSYVTPIPDQTLELVNSSFNPYLDDIKLNELDIMIVNDDGSLSSTSGKVEDAQAARPQGGNTPAPRPSDTPAPVTTPEPGAVPEPSDTPQGSEAPAPSETPSVPPAVTPVPEPAPETTPDPEVEPTPAPTPVSTPQTDPTVPEIGPGMEPVE